MEMPKPGPGHKKLEVFAGTWTGDEKMHPSEWAPKGGTATANLTGRVACDGFNVVGDYEQSTAGKVTFRGHSVWSFDETAQEVTLHWFDSMGMAVNVFRGKFAGQTLSLVCSGPTGHHRLVYDFSEKGTLRSKMEMSNDGKQWKAMFDGVYHKKN